MASISKLSHPTPAALSRSFSRWSSNPRFFISFCTRRVPDTRILSSAPSFLNYPRRSRSLVVSSSQVDGNGSVLQRTILHDLYEQQRQSPWYDGLCRPVTDLIPLIASGIRGLTCNPKLYYKQISSSEAYREEFRELIRSGKDVETACWKLIVRDIQDACKLFEPIYEHTGGGDGYVSVDISPRLANDSEGSVEAAKYLRNLVDQLNVYIKIPATLDCIASIRNTISLGISVDVTLIFSLSRYEAIIDAYLDGLEASGLDDLSQLTSVASFSIGRVDSVVDQLLEQIGSLESLNLRGKGAVALAALAYQLYQKKFAGPRWEALVKKGARKQRLLWSSTLGENPAYPDTLYIDSLIGPDTVSTMSEKVLRAFMDHGVVARSIDLEVNKAEGVYNALEKVGIDWGYVGTILECQGLDAFKKSFNSLLESMQEKAKAFNLVAL